MITYYKTDSSWVFEGAVQINPFAPLPPGSLAAPPETTGTEVAQLQGTEWVVLPEYPQQPAPPEPTPEQLREIAKAERAKGVDNIKVTTTAGNTFDGDETAQRRMASAITAMTDADLLPWVLHDNSIMMVNKSELIEALRLAGMQMASIWITPYTGQ